MHSTHTLPGAKLGFNISHGQAGSLQTLLGSVQSGPSLCQGAWAPPWPPVLGMG